TVTPISRLATESGFKIYIAGSDRGKSFGAMSLNPAISLNGAGSGDDALYYTSDNITGSNLFALNSSGAILWEQSLGGNFKNSSPSFSKGSNPKTYLGKNVMYIASKSGDIYCVNTDGKLVSSIKINDSFKNSVFVDANDPNADYVYAASATGNFYRLKLDFSNSQSQTFTSVYSVKLDDTSFSSSPVLNNSSVYVGGENGKFYQIIPNTGDVSVSWDLSLYNKNSVAKIIGTPLFDNITNSIIVPAGGYLFRIFGSTVTQSPLLELKEGVNSRNKPYGSVLNTNIYATGTIISSPVISASGNNLVYVANGNALFESNISSVDTFKNSANYCLGVSGRIDDSATNLSPLGNGVVALSTSSGGVRAAMVDTNMVNNVSPYINYFTLPLNSSTDNLLKYLPVNEFDSIGHSIKGINSSSIADKDGNVYFTLDNGAVKVLATP
ncbi:MAG: PQQ-binding-like beta-propeller repeat protein, partial [Candidatus Sericytochromatia bacterium]|nr:PQQ-binding-like beta-propeller repeat protein [Candidatus Sericytochromatia bacterium]